MISGLGVQINRHGLKWEKKVKKEEESRKEQKEDGGKNSKDWMTTAGTMKIIVLTYGKVCSRLKERREGGRVRR